MALFEMTLNDL